MTLRSALLRAQDIVRPQETGESDTSGRLWSIADWAFVALPPLVWLVCAWQRRWITDDGLIAARTVREILAGNGPVFNAGERVEANTSALWTWLIAGLSWGSGVSVYKVMMYAGLLLAPLGLLFALLGARKLHRRNSPGRRLVPLGALVVAVLPPFWDFATSGLEESLIFFWLGLCWWLLCGVDRESTNRRVYSTAVVLGLGWLVRPDMLVGTLCFLVGLWFVLRPTWLRSTKLLLTAAALPIAYEIFRMGYYGLLVPNTALVKEASSIHISSGFTYFNNFISPYHLWIPALLIAAVGAVAVNWRRFNQTDTAVVASVAVAALLMLVYVVVIGGDFMHARMLLPGTFMLLCPVSAIPLPSLTAIRRFAVTAVATTGVLAWAVLCAASLRMPQPPGVVPSNGITNERAFWVQRVGVAHPIDGKPYVLAILGNPKDRRSTAWLLANAKTTDPNHPILLIGSTQAELQLPLNEPNRPVGIAGDILGTLGVQTPLDGLVVDVHGLSYALGSHLDPRPNGRVGHDKTADNAWIIAEYSTATTAPDASAADIAAARQALSCSDLSTLIQATSAPMSWNRFWSNVADSFSLNQLRVSNNPAQAATTLCGNG